LQAEVEECGCGIGLSFSDACKFFAVKYLVNSKSVHIYDTSDVVHVGMEVVFFY
jgi:hypothetical protein